MAIFNFEVILEYGILVGTIVLLAFAGFFFSKKYLLKIIHKIISKTKSQWDDALIEAKFFEQLIHIIPPFIVVYFAQAFPHSIEEGISQIGGFWISVVVILTIDRFLTAFLGIYNTFQISKDKPIKGYVQLGKMVVYILGGIIALCILVGVSPWGVLSGIGAFTAVLMFVFKDTILSLVASIQIVANDLFKVGDWIEVEKFGADGEVIDIALHSVKIQNWDKTVVAIPTYKFMENSFKNWQGMSASGGRRIKRSLNIDLNTVKMCSKDLLEKLKNIDLLKEYIEEKSQDVDTSDDVTLNKRKLTNIGTFREYIKRYLESNSNIDTKNFTFLVRQLQPTSKGIPLEIYVFSNDNRWVAYEEIQADIFDHLIVALREFELKLYQDNILER
ncbi:MAG: mechanosensitive ion channel family protein [Campylobacterales bacterium]|nr:mechanosensitive ion channel family protein [Campylobacterales bacterium]